MRNLGRRVGTYNREFERYDEDIHDFTFTFQYSSNADKYRKQVRGTIWNDRNDATRQGRSSREGKVKLWFYTILATIVSCRLLFNHHLINGLSYFTHPDSEIWSQLRPHSSSWQLGLESESESNSMQCEKFYIVQCSHVAM